MVGMTTGMSLMMGKPYARDMDFKDEDTLRVILGVTGQMQGRVLISIPIDNAKKIASNMMMGMPVEELDDMSMSALSELGNMIMGTSATYLSGNGVLVDITPPMIEKGMLYIDREHYQSICVPLNLENRPYLEMNILVNTAA